MARSAETETIEIVLNGEPRRVPAGLSLEALLTWLQIDPARVAVELNREIVRKPAWATTIIDPAAQLEVVWFVGGGRE